MENVLLPSHFTFQSPLQTKHTSKQIENQQPLKAKAFNSSSLKKPVNRKALTDITNQKLSNPTNSQLKQKKKSKLSFKILEDVPEVENCFNERDPPEEVSYIHWDDQENALVKMTVNVEENVHKLITRNAFTFPKPKRKKKQLVFEEM